MSDEPNDGGPAFPTADVGFTIGSPFVHITGGMSVRTWMVARLFIGYRVRRSDFDGYCEDLDQATSDVDNFIRDMDL